MKKILRKVAVSILMMTMLLAFSAEAGTAYSGNTQAEAEQAMDVMTVTPRDSILSSASVEIYNETGGTIGVYIQTICNVEATQIRNTAILEKLVNNTWKEIVRHEYTADKADFPNMTLSYLTNEFTVKNQETDCYYRVRGIHRVTANGTTRTYSTETNGLWITEYR